MTILTCAGCELLFNAPNDGEISCSDGGRTSQSLRCILYHNPLTSEKVVQSVLQDIEYMEA
ncbi:hypothetical protein LCGC14_1083790 [marine sediment metagenome]|uniref:Uncharacterized protein n=1 Tax=marine sediment metagenome TaxID=412755 RepID=A0A0F9QKF7_9ZZZZ